MTVKTKVSVAAPGALAVTFCTAERGAGSHPAVLWGQVTPGFRGRGGGVAPPYIPLEANWGCLYKCIFPDHSSSTQGHLGVFRQRKQHSELKSFLEGQQVSHSPGFTLSPPPS